MTPILSFLVIAAAARASYEDRPCLYEGFIPDAKTAVTIAGAIFQAKLKLQSLERVQPLHVKMLDGCWVVSLDTSRERTYEISEPFVIALDPVVGSVVAFGTWGTQDLRKVMRKNAKNRVQLDLACKNRIPPKGG